MIRPVFRAVRKRESRAALAHRSPRLLVRRPKLLDERARQQLHELLERYEVLRTVIEFRERLQQLWDETGRESWACAGATAPAVRRG